METNVKILDIHDFTIYIKELSVKSKKNYITIYTDASEFIIKIKTNANPLRFHKSFTMKQLYDFMIENHFLTTTQSRKRNLINIRFIMAYTARYSGGYTYREIREYFGKHHATWVHACKITSNLLEVNDPHFVTLYSKFIKDFSNFLDKPTANE